MIYKSREVPFSNEKVMIKSVYEGLKASIIKVKTFQIILKITRGLNNSHK